jgi:hypothetical protein
MFRRTFSSFDAFFAANLHCSTAQGMVLGRKREDWVMTRLIVNGLSVQWGRPGDSVVVEGVAKPGGVTIYMLTEGPSGVKGDGCRLDDSSVMLAQTGHEFCFTNDSLRRWFTVYIPNGVLTGANGDATTVPASMHGVIQLPPHRIERFRSVVRQLDEAVHGAPADFESAAAQKAAEQKLVPEIRNLLAPPYEVEHKLGRHVVPPTESGEKGLSESWLGKSPSRPYSPRDNPVYQRVRYRFTARSQHCRRILVKSPDRTAARISSPVIGTTSVSSLLPRSISVVTVSAKPFHEIRKPSAHLWLRFSSFA